MFRRIVNKVKSSIWLYPAIYSVASLMLSVAVAFVDQRYTDAVAHDIHSLFYTTPELAKTVLGIIAGAFITIATFTFSTAMVVLTMYSSQFTPRVVENFLNNQTTMKSFGVFLSGFIYAITSLLLIKADGNGNRVLAASVGVLYVIVGLIYFLIFINNVSTHVQASGLIQRLHDEAMNRISQYRDFVSQKKRVLSGDLEKWIGQRLEVDISSHADGYIQEINYDRLIRLTVEHRGVVCVRKVVGQFVSTKTRVMSICLGPGQDLPEEVIESFQRCLLIGNKRTEAQDFSFTVQKIVEIALKALSPGINDPNTAIHCLQMIGLLLRNLADQPGGYILLTETDDEGQVICESYDFEILLYDTYQQIVHYGQSDAAVMIAVFKSLRLVKDNASSENSRLINAYASLLFEKLKTQHFDHLDLQRLEREAETVPGTVSAV